MFQHTAARRRLVRNFRGQAAGFRGFNTQPPEGGWEFWETQESKVERFQHTAARRRLGSGLVCLLPMCLFQHTAARRRLGQAETFCRLPSWFQHTAARRRLVAETNHSTRPLIVSTHSRPKAAGQDDFYLCRANLFQHTAARRRLGFRASRDRCGNHGFNTQPPEGGWENKICAAVDGDVFQHTAARRRLVSDVTRFRGKVQFQHTAARRRLAHRLH